MRKKIVAILPFLVMPVFIPLYCLLDNLVLVEVFGCGCVPSTQTNLLNIPFNANDLRLVVFSIATVTLSVWSVFVSKKFIRSISKIIYCICVALLNVILSVWVVNAFLWA